MCRHHPSATEANVEFLTTVVDAPLDQGRMPDDFDEVDYRAGFGAWTSERERCGFSYVGEDETEHRLRLAT